MCKLPKEAMPLVVIISIMLIAGIVGSAFMWDAHARAPMQIDPAGNSIPITAFMRTIATQDNSELVEIRDPDHKRTYLVFVCYAPCGGGRSVAVTLLDKHDDSRQP